MKANKYYYCKVIQQNFGQGFEDVSEYPCNSQGVTTQMSGKFRELKSGRKVELTLLSYDLSEYRYKSPYPTRVIQRRELNELQPSR